MLAVPTTKLPKPTYDAETEVCQECYKCGGTGFYCMGIENGKPYSHTGFDCFPCGGTGWIVKSKKSAEPACRVSRSGEVVDLAPKFTEVHSMTNGTWTVDILKGAGSFKFRVVGPNYDETSDAFGISSEEAKQIADALISSTNEPTLPTPPSQLVSLERTVKPTTAKVLNQMSAPKVDYASLSDEELKDYFKGKLATDAAWVRRAIVAIWKYQTEEEKRTEETKVHNNVGFTGADAKILSSFAGTIQANRYSLTEKQLKVAFKLMPKYAGQLVRIVRNKQ